MHMKKNTNSLIEIKSVSIRIKITHFQGFWPLLRNRKLMCDLINVACTIDDLMDKI